MKTKTYCFGTGREGFTKTVVNRDRIEPSRNMPPPNSYNPQKPLGAEAVGFKLKYKINYYDAEMTAIKMGVPAPGTYEDQQSLSSNGQYFSSEMVSAKSAKWCKDSKLKAPGNRFYPTPGPGYHE